MAETPKPYIITVVGPESSGKTTLARQLAQFSGVPWVPEYAREYLESNGRTYAKEDLETIAIRQLESIMSVASESGAYMNQDMLNDLVCFISNKVATAHAGKSVLFFPQNDFGANPRQVLIVDSGLLSIKIWSEIKYGSTIPFVESALENDQTDLYVLCRPVYPWSADPLREAPLVLERVWIYNQFLKYLVTRNSRSIEESPE